VILRYASGVRVGHRHARTDTGKDTVRWYGGVPTAVKSRLRGVDQQPGHGKVR
jgi:hypothetical protein